MVSFSVQQLCPQLFPELNSYTQKVFFFFLKLNLRGESENSKNCKAIIFMRMKPIFLFFQFKQLKKII